MRGRSWSLEMYGGAAGALGGLAEQLPPLFAVGSDLRGDHPLFPVVSEAWEELAGALTRGETHYTDVMGIEILRWEVSRLLEVLGLGRWDPQALLITAGEQESRFLAIQTLGRAGWALLLPAVVHPGVRLAAAAVPGRLVEQLPVDETLTPEPEVVREAFSRHRVAALYLEVPNRFTGRVISARRFEALVEEVQRAGGVLVIDVGLVSWLPPASVPAMLADSSAAGRVWLLGSLFPGTGVDRWLIGYLAVPGMWVGQAKSLKQMVAICTCAPVQWAAVGAVRAAMEGHWRWREHLERLRGEVTGYLPREAILPGEAATVVAISLAGRGGRGGLPVNGLLGEAFGLPGALRLTITPSGESVEAARLLARWLTLEEGASPS